MSLCPAFQAATCNLLNGIVAMGSGGCVGMLLSLTVGCVPEDKQAGRLHACQAYRCASTPPHLHWAGSIAGGPPPTPGGVCAVSLASPACKDDARMTNVEAKLLSQRVPPHTPNALQTHSCHPVRAMMMSTCPHPPPAYTTTCSSATACLHLSPHACGPGAITAATAGAVHQGHKPPCCTVHTHHTPYTHTTTTTTDTGTRYHRRPLR